MLWSFTVSLSMWQSRVMNLRTNPFGKLNLSLWTDNRNPTGIKNTAATGLKTRKNIIAPTTKKTRDKKTKTHPVFYSNFTDQAAKSKSTSRKTGRLVSGPTSLGAWPGRDEAKTDAAGSKVGLWNPGPSFTKEMSAKRKSSPKTTGNQRGK